MFSFVRRTIREDDGGGMVKGTLARGPLYKCIICGTVQHSQEMITRLDSTNPDTSIPWARCYFCKHNDGFVEIKEE